MEWKSVNFRTHRKLCILGVLFLLTLVKVHVPVVEASKNDSWSSIAPMRGVRSALAAVAVEGWLYVLGGWDGDNYLAAVEEYDPTTNSWRSRAAMSTRRGDLAVAVVDGKIYAFGGYRGYPSTEYLATVEEYNPVTNQWRNRAAMPTARGDLAVAAVGGRLYVLGGYDGNTWFGTVEEYDPTTNSWRSRAAMPTARGKLAAAAVGGLIYAIGGFNRNDRWMATVEEYDPATNQWRNRAAMSTARGDLAVAVMGGRIYALGGYDEDEGKYFEIMEEYNPATNQWRSRAALPPPPKKGLAAAMVGGRIYALGGYEGGRIYSTVHEYDPPYFDTDGDGLADDDEVGRYGTDPLVPDADTDTDEDGLTNVEEVDKYDTDPRDPDSDGDELPDRFELEYGLDPLANSDAQEDPDQDDLANFQEYLLHTNPTIADTDEDGLLDGEEVDVYKLDPLAADTDGDTYSDGEEVTVGTDPNDPEEYPITTTSETTSVFQTVTTVEIPRSEPGMFRDLLNFSFALTSIQTQTVVAVTIISSLALLGAAVKAAFLPPPILGKKSLKDFLKRLLWYLLYPFTWFFGHIVYDPLCRRLKKEAVTTQKARRAILQLLDERGVAYLREIERAVGSGIFGVMWHLQVLEDFGYIRHTRIGKYLVYYLKEYGGLDTSSLELGVIFKNVNARSIIIYIMNHPGTYQSEIARALGLHHTSVRHHLLPMKENEFVEEFSDGRKSRYFILEEKKSHLDYLMEKIKPEFA